MAYKHGKSKEKIYSVWHGMIARCEKEYCKEYKNYGARGISVCDEWHDSKKFIDWSLNNGYEVGLSIDRIDTNGNYEPNNCRWVDMVTQQNNTRRNRKVTIGNETHNVSEWARIKGIPYHYIYRRYEEGWSIEKAITEPIKQEMEATYNGETKTFLEWSKVLGCNVKTLYARKKRGWKDYEIIGKPIRKVGI